MYLVNNVLENRIRAVPLLRKCGAKHGSVEDELADQLDEAEVKN